MTCTESGPGRSRRNNGSARFFLEAEAGVEARNSEKKNSEFAIGEINQEFKSQRFICIKRVDGQIRLKEIKLACMENWN